MMQDTPRFGGHTTETINQQLTEAASVYHDTDHAERLLLAAHAQDPNCLAVYFSLYKFYFYKQRLQDAERLTLAALSKAAELGSFPDAWPLLTLHTASWSDVKHPAHFYLFSLKALAFIHLRQGHRKEADALLAKLSELDPQDQVGGSVIQALSDASD